MMNKEEIFTRWQDPTIEKLQKENKDLQQRIDKAIEYIKSETEIYDKNPIEGTWLYNLYKVLEILGGKE